MSTIPFSFHMSWLLEVLSHSRLAYELWEPGRGLRYGCWDRRKNHQFFSEETCPICLHPRINRCHHLRQQIASTTWYEKSNKSHRTKNNFGMTIPELSSLPPKLPRIKSDLLFKPWGRTGTRFDLCFARACCTASECASKGWINMNVDLQALQLLDTNELLK